MSNRKSCGLALAAATVLLIGAGQALANGWVACHGMTAAG